MKSDAPPSPMDGDIMSKTERSGQSYGLERSTTAPRSKTGEERQGLDPVPLASKREASLPRMKS